MIILASASKQRCRLLTQIGIEPYVFSVPIDEHFDGIDLASEIQTVAERKVDAVAAKVRAEKHLSKSDHWIVGADTVILHDHQIYGKPKNAEDAVAMIKMHSGKTHDVMTGICVRHFFTDRTVSAVCETTVEFSDLSQDTVNWYVSTGEWRDAAGGYRIQGRGACLVRAIHGSYSNVVGLPLELIYGMLRELDYRFR
ncbi:MAG: septum formation protein Maf [Spirochaetales bacterium]|nr:septum formation protein Maf [Spirochaetales bacterium]